MAVVFIALIISILFEVLAIYLFINTQTQSTLLLFFLLHAFASIFAALFLWFFIPKKYQNPKVYSIALLSLFNFLVPVICFFAFVIYIILWRSFKEKENIQYERVIFSELLTEKVTLHKRKLGESSLNVFANNPNAPSDLRLKAFLLLKDLGTPKSINLIKRGLKDRSDEIRLLSFSVINRMEKEINSNIHKIMQKYESVKDEEKKIDYAGKLAKLYWEYIYSGVADSEFMDFLYRQVEHYAKIGSKKEGDPFLYIILGKVELKRKNIIKSREFFEKALAYGASEYKTKPFLAEIYYELGEYEKAKEIFTKTPCLKLDPYLYPIFAIWSR